MLNQETLEQIATGLQDQEIDEQTVQALRNAWPDVHFTYCTDDDIHSGKPVFESEKFNLYLVSSSDTCLALTPDLSKATGLVIAEVIPDED